MLKSFFYTKEWLLWSWGGTILLGFMLWGQVQLSVWLNDWYKRFYNILQKANDIDAFWSSMYEFTYIAGSIIGASVAVYYFAQHYAFRWRQAITYYYLPYWESSEKTIEGASQRIQEDTYSFARGLETLALGLFKAILTLIAFIPILWELSSKITIPWLVAYEGSLVWIALITSLGGLVVSYIVGIKLPGLEYENQKVEAAYRKQLVYSEDDKKYAEVPIMIDFFENLRTNYFRMFNHYTYFKVWSVLYSQVTRLLPYLLMGPSLFKGIILLGIITQTGNAFRKVNNSFSYLIKRWTQITKFISVVKRLREFEKKLIENNKKEE